VVHVMQISTSTRHSAANADENTDSQQHFCSLPFALLYTWEEAAEGAEGAAGEAVEAVEAVVESP